VEIFVPVPFCSLIAGCDENQATKGEINFKGFEIGEYPKIKGECISPWKDLKELFIPLYLLCWT